jgi:hypothetical protein
MTKLDMGEVREEIFKDWCITKEIALDRKE